jgi:hypothetical protein
MADEDGNEKYAMKQQASSPSVKSSGGAVERSITVRSAKSGKTFKSLGWGTTLGLDQTFKTNEQAPQLEFTDSDMGTGQGFTRTASLAADGITVEKAKTVMVPRPSVEVHFGRVDEPPISWDGSTAADAASYLSLERQGNMVHHPFAVNLPSPMSPSQSMVVSYQTPPAVETQTPAWESAEVISPDGVEDVYGGVETYTSLNHTGDTRIDHPFANSAAYISASRTSNDSIRKDGNLTSRNPFADQIYNPFAHEDDNASQHPPKSTGSGSPTSFFTTETTLPSHSNAFATAESTGTVAHHERVESNERAIASLIAALDISHEEARERLSAAALPTPRASDMSGLSYATETGEAGSEYSQPAERESVGTGRFPMPPMDMGRR